MLGWFSNRGRFRRFAGDFDDAASFAGPRGPGCRRRGAGAMRDRSESSDAPTLAQARPGERVTVRRLDGCGAARQRLLDLGVHPGAEVEMVRNAPLNDPIEVRLGGLYLAMRRAEARRIEVANG